MARSRPAGQRAGLAARALAAALLVARALGGADPGCLQLVFPPGAALPAAARGRAAQLPVQCASPSTPRSRALCYLTCGFCTVRELALGLRDDFFEDYCINFTPLPANEVVVRNLTIAALNATTVMGVQWIQPNVTAAYEVLLAGMPVRDAMALFSEPFRSLDFIAQSVRLALEAWPFAASLGVPWPVFAANVLPYSLLDEKVDYDWRPRARFHQLLRPLLDAAAPASVTAAMHVVADAMPSLQALGVLATSAGGATTLQPGIPISWMSETSPGYLSPQQVAEHAGSCTGTAITMAAAARAVGLPARVAGCSQSVPGDDHHFVEFYDPASPGPFGDYWHTKEGTSKGNEGGPWDAPSGPMNGCLQALVPRSRLNTMWAGAWGASEALPMLWSNNAWATTFARVGGVNRCGAYCAAWGCGANNTEHYTQAECEPAAE